MKTKALPIFLSLTVAILFMSFSDPYSIKRISDANFRYEFYTTNKIIKPKEGKIYYWFKGGLIHNAQYGMAGELLNDKFIKMYHSNQLAEQGFFKNGLKTGLWKNWYPNGLIESVQKWKNGLRTGDFYHYNTDGLITEQGHFKRNLKHGIWIDYIKKDTVIYKNGVVFVKKIKPSAEGKAKIKEEKKKADAEKKSLRKEAKAQKAKAKEAGKTSENKPKEGTFFKRLFGKKQPKQNVNG